MRAFDPTEHIRYSIAPVHGALGVKANVDAIISRRREQFAKVHIIRPAGRGALCNCAYRMFRRPGANSDAVGQGDPESHFHDDVCTRGYANNGSAVHTYP